MSTRYQVLQHEQKPYWLSGCPLLMASHALTKDTTTDLVFLQCKFENLSNKRIKALTIHVECYDVTNQPLASVDSFTYLDIDVANAKTFGDQTPVSLPDRETRAFHIIPQKVVFDDNSIWENADNQPFVLAEYEQKSISSLGDLADQYKRDLHDICSKANAHAYLPARKDGFTICGCGKIMLDSTKTCPACSVSIDALFALNNEENLTFHNAQYEQEQRVLERTLIQERNQEQLNQHKRKKRLIRLIAASAAICLIATPFIAKKITRDNLVKSASSRVGIGFCYTLYLDENGDLHAIGNEEYFPKELEDIKHIKQLSANDGKVAVVTKDNIMYDNATEGVIVTKQGKLLTKHFDISRSKNDWDNMDSVSVSPSHIVGITKNGTPQAFGYNEYGQCNISGWENIKQLSAGIDYTVGLRTNGTCIMTGDNQQGQCNVNNWTDITSISSSYHYIVGLKRDGTVVVTGDDSYFDEQELSHWRNIIAIAAGEAHTVGLKRDGTVIAAGNNNVGQCNVSDWTDIIAIVAGSNRTIGIKADGTLVATGGNEDGQCNVNGIKLW